MSVPISLSPQRSCWSTSCTWNAARTSYWLPHFCSCLFLSVLKLVNKMTQLEWKIVSLLFPKPFGFASHFLKTQEFYNGLQSLHEVPIPSWTSFPILSISMFLPCWTPHSRFFTVPPCSLFSFCFFPQMVPGPPPIIFWTHISPCQWGFHNHPFKLHPSPHAHFSPFLSSLWPQQLSSSCLQFIWLNCLISLVFPP